MAKDSAPAIFVSYASADRPRVVDLVEALAQRGFGLWLDQSGIAGGENFGIKIVDAIRSSRVLLLFCSGTSLLSKNVRQEVQLAWKYDLRYIPVLLEAINIPVDFQYWLEGVQLIAGFTLDRERLITAVIAALRRSGVDPQDSTPAVGKGSITKDAPLLPYLVNREQQEDVFVLAIEQHFRLNSRRPLVFLVHGDVRECLDSFLDRLRTISLPRVLRQQSQPDFLNWFDFLWPSTAPYPHMQEQRLRRAVADALDLPSMIPAAQLRDAMARLGGPVVLCFHLTAADWTRDEATISTWVSRWREFPDLPTAQPLIFVLCIKYVVSSPSWFGRRRDRRVRLATQAALRDLSQRDSLGLPVSLLPELMSPSLADVEQWVRAFLRLPEVESILGMVRPLFRGADHRIPMDHLALQLRAVIRAAA